MNKLKKKFRLAADMISRSVSNSKTEAVRIAAGGLPLRKWPLKFRENILKMISFVVEYGLCELSIMKLCIINLVLKKLVMRFFLS